jgi:hypothetical protein
MAAPGAIIWHFQTHPGPALTCVFVWTGAKICLGVFTVNAVGRKHFLGAGAVGL